MIKEINSEIVKEYGRNAGADVVGIAASTDFVLAPVGFSPTDVLAECLSVIVLGATFPAEVLNDIAEYTASRNVMLTEMTNKAKAVAKRIRSDGYKTTVVSASGGKWLEKDGKKEHYGYISLKHAAEIAGLGLIGKNYLLTNPQYGNLLWLSAVLTNADLIPDQKYRYTICDNCNKCVEACPERALDDLTSFGRKGCSKYFTIEDKKFKIKCYSCRTVCPYCFGIN
jgi:epoxyqueuosine reductase QueG